MSKVLIFASILLAAVIGVVMMLTPQSRPPPSVSLLEMTRELKGIVQLSALSAENYQETSVRGNALFVSVSVDPKAWEVDAGAQFERAILQAGWHRVKSGKFCKYPLTLDLNSGCKSCQPHYVVMSQHDARESDCR
jgi:hypothetical protein